MLPWSHLGIHRRDFALLVNQVTDSRRISGLRVGTRAVRQSGLAPGVTQQFERIELLGEGGVGFDAVEAHTQDNDIALFKIGIAVAEPATFGGSARSVGFGKEPQQHFASTKVG
jgi:hypothetical protein